MRGWFALVVVLLFASTLHAERAKSGRVLRVCADPNQAPLSSETTPGLEQALATLIAKELDATVEYTWWAQRRGFIRNTLSAGSCDVVMSVPSDLGMVRTTAPYYRSGYAIVTRRIAPPVTSLDDPRLRELRIGVPLFGDDGVNPPPVHALARRGIVDNVIGYNVVGDYSEESPPAAVMRALDDGAIDVAIAWGPLAGAYARAHTKPRKASPYTLTLLPVRDGELTMAFDISLGVRKRDTALATELDAVLAKRAVDIEKLLARWGVPTLEVSR